MAAVVQTSEFQYYAGLDPFQRRLLYEPIVLKYAIIQSCNLAREEPESHATADFDNLQSDSEAFRVLVNKLAHVCDNERGGNSVTAMTILEGTNGPEFVLAANRKDEEETRATARFVTNLLQLAGQNPQNLSSDALEKRVLWMILAFNMPRITEYKDKLDKALGLCLEDHERRQSEDEALKTLRDCERLINLIHNAQLAITGIKKAVRTKARSSEFLRSGPWCELKHYLGRWHSYRQAANVIVYAAAAWPLLFQDFKITSLPSSTRISKPIVQSDLTAVAIVQHMEAFEKVKMPELMQNAEDLRRIGLDKAIQIQLLRRTFRPIIHAEVLIHHYLTKNRITRPNRFWRQWQYIGASKPTCRLCHYYFSSHSQSQIQVRPSHLNLYPNWRLPEISDEDDTEAREAHRKLLKSIAEKVRNDAKRTLRHRTTKSKQYDSNTYSATPRFLVKRSELTNSDGPAYCEVDRCSR
ncbi:OTT_1508-like deaminase [Fusarium oxysporum f. sp. vasinfectum]|nr:OTT_1508-like deaminase [Fusarium oxysporum f. sp. vasinfectum]